MAEAVDLHRLGRQAFGEADALLHRLGHFLVVQRVARRVDQAPAIGDGDAAPAIEQLDESRRAAFALGGLALGADGAGMGDEFVGDVALLPRSSSRAPRASPRSATRVS